MTDTPARLFRLLSLLQTPREWPGGELADRLGVSRRTIRRDVERLRDLGYPVEASLGVTGGYRLVAGAALPPLLLDDEEAIAIAVGLRTAAVNAVTGMEEASVRALSKLEQVLPTRLRARVSALAQATVPLLWGQPNVDAARLTVLAAAISNRERLRFRYRAADGRDSRRLVEPHRLVAAGRRWYLVAYDDDRDDWRTFRVDRITEPQPVGTRIPEREIPGGDAAAYVERALSGHMPSFRAVATVHAPAAEVRRWFGESEQVEPIDAQRCRVTMRPDALEWAAFRLLSLHCEVEVHEPPELVDHLRDIGGRATRAAGPPGPITNRTD